MREFPLFLGLLISCSQAEDTGQLPQFPFGSMTPSSISELTAKACHQSLVRSEQLQPFLIDWRDEQNPELTPSGETMNFMDTFQTLFDYGDGFFDHGGVYAGFGEGGTYCYGRLKSNIYEKNFWVELDLFDSACGGSSFVAEQNVLRLHFFHEDRGVCQAFFTHPEGGPAVFSYDLNVDLSHIEAASAVRVKR